MFCEGVIGRGFLRFLGLRSGNIRRLIRGLLIHKPWRSLYLSPIRETALHRPRDLLQASYKAAYKSAFSLRLGLVVVFRFKRRRQIYAGLNLHVFVVRVRFF
jgi:hypothetical protein